MEKIVKQSLLYDFYGELLTDHQKSIYEDYVLNDIGISEIAEERGISRQGVHDLIRRCDKILNDYEEKLHLLERFTIIKDEIGEIKTSMGSLDFDRLSDDDRMIVTKVTDGIDKIIDRL